jgi:hypothetical protein
MLHAGAAYCALTVIFATEQAKTLPFKGEEISNVEVLLYSTSIP